VVSKASMCRTRTGGTTTSSTTVCCSTRFPRARSGSSTSGCGEGLLTRQLAALGAQVVGVDQDAPSLELARHHTLDANVEYVRGDLLRPPFADETFDAVMCVMALHHVDMAGGLRRMAALVKPRGVIGVIGVARTRPRDVPHDAAGAVLTRILRRRRGNWVQPAPMCWPPPSTYRDVRLIATAELAGASYRRRLLFRYTLLWMKPG
jgi:SAM-dependent methyltransferase